MLIAVLAIILHMVIPHDHHLSEACAGEENECPASGKDKDHNHGGPVHCHACNDFTSEKSVILLVVNNLKSKCFLSENELHCKLPALHFAYFKEKDISGVLSDACLTSNNLLRAPPSII
jgi:hypothetical protein